MKRCTYCGKEYPDSASICVIDQNPLADIGAKANGAARQDITLGKRIALWSLAFIVAAIAMAAPFPGSLLHVWLFPLGLIALLVPSDWQPRTSWIMVVLTGWLIYAGLSIYGLSQQRKRKYLVAYAILILLLLLNVAGCHVLLRQISVGK